MTEDRLVQAPHASTSAGLLIGTPIGVVVVWVIGLWLPADKVLPNEVATAVGAVAGALFGELYMIYSRFRDRLLGGDGSSPQAGFARVQLLAGLSLCGLVALSLLGGCTHTKAAYRAASTPDEYAFVLAEHYAALLHEAADLAARPTTPPELTARMREVEQAATPAVHQMRELADAFVATRNAQTEVELQKAVDDVVRLIADLVRAVTAARSHTALEQPLPLVESYA